MEPGTIVKHSLYGKAVVQTLNETLHPNYKTAGLCFIKLNVKPAYFSTDVILTFEDGLEVCNG